jgi:SIR2-like protein
MLMVVFGAGASYDSAPSLPDNREWRPPLADELFHNRKQFASIASQYTKLLPIIPLLREPDGGSVEQVLERFRDEAQKRAERRCQLAAVRYYLRDILWSCTHEWIKEAWRVTNYRSLLDKIDQNRPSGGPLLLVTFNYDTLLEDALSDHGFRTDDIQDYVKSHPKYKLIKLHGSINWSRILISPIGINLSRYDLIDQAASIQVSNTFVVNNDRQDQQVIKGTFPRTDELVRLFPAIAIPVQRKDEFECPKEHLELLRSLLPKVSKMLFIGWRGQEDHFLQMLREGLKSLDATLDAFMVVSGTRAEAESIAARIRTSLGDIHGKAAVSADAGFSAFIRKKEGDDFLKP